ncbi:hypothetical protein LTR37_003823 [Vermiconidia calcicola]|uniref:Uncharacterized protein n=1 Tax=Vermiconidia calcicola TaxID=1690605 RepID=A0ACC3NQM0_9PEZI|nr:hypothetical protein LTR37_003823 [Vermiconidia calcicola]
MRPKNWKAEWEGILKQEKDHDRLADGILFGSAWGSRRRNSLRFRRHQHDQQGPSGLRKAIRDLKLAAKERKRLEQSSKNARVKEPSRCARYQWWKDQDKIAEPASKSVEDSSSAKSWFVVIVDVIGYLFVLAFCIGIVGIIVSAYAESSSEEERAAKKAEKRMKRMQKQYTPQETQARSAATHDKCIDKLEVERICERKLKACFSDWLWKWQFDHEVKKRVQAELKRQVPQACKHDVDLKHEIDKCVSSVVKRELKSQKATDADVKLEISQRVRDTVNAVVRRELNDRVKQAVESELRRGLEPVVEELLDTELRKAKNKAQYQAPQRPAQKLKQD